MEFFQPSSDIFSHLASDSESQSKDDTTSWRLSSTHLRAYKKTLAIESTSDVSGPINAIDRLLQNLPALQNKNAGVTRDLNWEIEVRAEKKRMEIEGDEEMEGPVNAIDRLLQGLPELGSGKKAMKRVESWGVETVCGSGNTSDGEGGSVGSGKGRWKEEKDAHHFNLSRASTLGVEEEVHQKTDGTQLSTLLSSGMLQETTSKPASRKGKEPAHMASIEERDDGASEDGESEMESNSASLVRFDKEEGIYHEARDSYRHQEYSAYQAVVSDAESGAESQPEFQPRRVKRWQIALHWRRETERLEGRRKQECRKEARWKEELKRVEILQMERSERQLGRPERRQARQRMRDEAAQLAAQQELRDATTHFVQWSPAMMPKLSTATCREITGCQTPESEESEGLADEVECDTETDDEEIMPDQRYCHYPQIIPKVPDKQEIHAKARSANAIMQAEKFRWEKLKDRVPVKTKRATEARKEEAEEVVTRSCNHCVEEHMDDLLPTHGPWWKERGSTESRGSECERECRDTVDRLSRPVRIPLGLIRRARGEEEEDDLAGDGGSESESDDGEHGGGGSEGARMVPASNADIPDEPLGWIPNYKPPILDFEPYNGCNEVTQELYDKHKGPKVLNWKTNYVDLSSESTCLRDFREFAVARSSRPADKDTNRFSYTAIGSSANDTEAQEKDKMFWENLAKELEFDECEVAADLHQNNVDHGKNEDEYNRMANDVHRSFIDNRKGRRDSQTIEPEYRLDESEDLSSAFGENTSRRSSLSVCDDCNEEEQGDDSRNARVRDEEDNPPATAEKPERDCIYCLIGCYLCEDGNEKQGDHSHSAGVGDEEDNEDDFRSVRGDGEECDLDDDGDDDDEDDDFASAYGDESSITSDQDPPVTPEKPERVFIYCIHGLPFCVDCV